MCINNMCVCVPMYTFQTHSLDLEYKKSIDYINDN